MSNGFLWFAQNNNSTDYVELSIKLAESIKKHNRQNKICVVTDEKSKFVNKNVDIVKVLAEDHSHDHKIKWANEYKAFTLSPFTHTIKVEADMLWTINTDWWWYHLWQHDLVFSVDCFNYRDQIVKNTPYRKLFLRNDLPNIYNGLMYFRRSQYAKKFFNTAKAIVENWKEVQTKILIACHDEYPSTDVVYALAYKILDPTNSRLIDFDWFKFIHHKPSVNGLSHIKDQDNYLYTNMNNESYFLGDRKVSRVWHYNKKDIHVRTA